MYSMIRLGRYAGDLSVFLMRLVLVLVHNLSGGMLALGSKGYGESRKQAAQLGGGVRGREIMETRGRNWLDLGLPNVMDVVREMERDGEGTSERGEQKVGDGPGRSRRLESVLREGTEARSAAGVGPGAQGWREVVHAGRNAPDRAGREIRKERSQMKQIWAVAVVMAAMTAGVLVGAILGFERGGEIQALLWGTTMGVLEVATGAGCFYLGGRLTVRPSPRGGSSPAAGGVGRRNMSATREPSDGRRVIGLVAAQGRTS